MIVHTPSLASTLADMAHPTEHCEDLTDRREHDPIRQLFHRHANHLEGARTRKLQASVRHRLFNVGQ